MSYPRISKITSEKHQDRLKAIQQAFPIFGTDKSLRSLIIDHNRTQTLIIGELKMGSRAKAKIWVGIATDKYYEFLEDETYSNIKFNDKVSALLEENSLKLSVLEQAEEMLGIGVIILNNDWDNGAEEIDLIELNNKTISIQPLLKEVFEIMGIKGEIKTYLSSDFS